MTRYLTQAVEVLREAECVQNVHLGGSSWPTAQRTPWAFVHILTFHLILHTCWMLRNWSGVGGGGDDNIPCTCTHVGCYATGQGWVGGGDDNIPCTCTHVGCYATGQGWGGGMITFLALAHMLDATQLVRGGWGGDDNIPCTCAHVGCYATGQALNVWIVCGKA